MLQTLIEDWNQRQYLGEGISLELDICFWLNVYPSGGDAPRPMIYIIQKTNDFRTAVYECHEQC